MVKYFVTGTDTDAGKSVASAWLVRHLEADYWKPVQSGHDGGTDPERIAAWAGLGPDRILPCIYELTEPLSPHESARRDGVTIDMSRFTVPETDRNLVMEGAGGLMVPLNDDHYVIDLIAQLNVPVILVARSTLGTINHTLLSLKAIRDRGLELKGVIMSGPLMPHNREALEFYGKVDIIAEIPQLDTISPETLESVPALVEL